MVQLHHRRHRSNVKRSSIPIPSSYYISSRLSHLLRQDVLTPQRAIFHSHPPRHLYREEAGEADSIDPCTVCNGPAKAVVGPSADGGRADGGICGPPADRFIAICYGPRSAASLVPHA